MQSARGDVHYSPKIIINVIQPTTATTNETKNTTNLQSTNSTAAKSAINFVPRALYSSNSFIDNAKTLAGLTDFRRFRY